MTTINLEKSLIKENRKLATPSELLLVKEYETHTELLENDVLSRIGFNHSLKAGKKIKDTIDSRLQQTKNFKQERVFHVSQIKAICDKYYLRFLRGEYYAGIIDKELPTKITNFEAAYQVKCTIDNIKICAPVESFELQEEPKDPLLFYQINNEYYYLIHKWGNDLSVFRASLPLFANGLFCWLAPIVALSAMIFFGKYWILGFVITSALWSLFCLGHLPCEDKPFRILRQNNWQSQYKN